MLKLPRFSRSELMGLVALIGAAAALAHAIVTNASAENGPAVNRLAANALTTNASTGNPFSLTALIDNSLPTSGVEATGVSALESLNGVAVEAIRLPAGPQAPMAVPHAPAPHVTVEGTQFRVAFEDGSVLPQTALPGIVLAVGDGSGRQRQLRIDAVEPDLNDPAGEVILYSFSEKDAASGEWRNVCMPDVEGRRMGFPLPGAFTPEMLHVERPGRFLITCTGGVEGKCIRFGYEPWRSAPDGTSLAPYYQACVRLIRADYLGDGVGNTRNGTMIDIFDKIGIQQDEPVRGMTLEAAWGPDGAVCVRHTRLQDVLSTTALAERSPDLVRATCDESAPALLFNRSFPR